MTSSKPSGRAAALAVDIRAVHRALRLRVREHGGSGEVTPAQMGVLVRLEAEAGATVSGLARAEGMRPQSMREIVAPLQDMGFIASSPDPQDGRQTLLSLTPRCVRWIEQGRAASHDWLTQTIAERLTAAEQKSLHEALRLLRRVVES